MLASVESDQKEPEMALAVRITADSAEVGQHQDKELGLVGPE